MTKTKNILFSVLKILLFFILVYVLFLQVNLKDISLEHFKSIFQNISAFQYRCLILAIVLMPINWLLESFKWKTLTRTLQADFRLKDALNAVLIGVFFGFVTPNRVGEFGGRLFKIKKGNKVKALSLSLVGGFAQFIVTFSVGLLCSISLVQSFFSFSNTIIFLVSIFSFIALILIYFNFKKLSKFLFSFQFLKSFSEKYIFNFRLPNILLLKILIITFIRYNVYIIQYILIFYFLGENLELVFLFQTFSIMLIIQTIVPSFALIDIGIRGNVLIFLLGKYVDNQLIILVLILLVWILNLVIPAIVGYFKFVKLKLEVIHEKSNHINIINE